MKAVNGFTKDDYRIGDTVKEFDTIEAAAVYLAQKHKRDKNDMIEGILNDTNCDAIYFEDGSVIVNEYPKHEQFKVIFEYASGHKGVCIEDGKTKLFDTEQEATEFAARLNNQIEDEMKQFFPVWSVEKA